MEIIYQPHINRELESLIERIYPPRICVDNESHCDCTVVKVDSANKHGILLEMVQVLTDLDLVISKSYISSDGEWFMDVFHVTDQLGNKVTEENLLLYMEQSLCASRVSEISNEVQSQRCLGRAVRSRQVLSTTESAALEITGMDRPGLISEISAALVDLGCNITGAVSWTHNNILACIFYVEDASNPRLMLDPSRLVELQEQLATIVEVHDGPGERTSLRLTTPNSGRTHTERRLHQLLYAAKDYERCHACGGEIGGRHKKGCDGTHISIERCIQKGYWVVNVKSRDRQKLLFDTVCVLTDMQYNVFHAAVSSRGSMAYQEYYVRHREGFAVDKESEIQKLTLCLIASIERRISHGLRLELCTKNRMGLLSDITRVFRENGLSLSRIEVGTHGEKALGSFYVTDSSGHDAKPDLVEWLRKETGGSITAVHESPIWANTRASSSSRARQDKNNEWDRSRSSIGSLIWSHLGRLSSNFGLIGSW